MKKTFFASAIRLPLFRYHSVSPHQVVLITLLLSGAAVQAQVRVIQGPTPIPTGDARSAADPTVMNDRLAFALAVQSPPPHGVPRGALAPVVAAEITRRHLAAGSLAGTVTATDGRPLAAPAVVIAQAGKPCAWTIGDASGHYRLVLPTGDYAAYAAANGYSQTPPLPVSLASAGSMVRDFGGLKPPGTLHLSVTDRKSAKPLDARIVIDQGQQPLVEFLGRRTFFTELDRRGQADLALAPGDYAFSVSFGKDVLALAAYVKTSVVSGKAAAIAVPIDVLFDPAARGWYSADLHHHADQAETVTPAPYLARSQLAAGLDLLFVSDHDSLANHQPLQAIADRRGVPFIPSGYLTSVKAGVAPGGFDPGFDLLEITASDTGDNDKVLTAAWDFWNAGQRHYLAAGTDVHDVWNDVSGRFRTFVHVGAEDSPLTALSFSRALKAGHAYVTYGPLIYPDHMFGDTIAVTPDQPFVLGFDLQAADGLKQASLISRGVVVKTIDFPATKNTAHADFTVTASEAGWYALSVEDDAGHRAYTDPIWTALKR